MDGEEGGQEEGWRTRGGEEEGQEKGRRRRRDKRRGGGEEGRRDKRSEGGGGGTREGEGQDMARRERSKGEREEENVMRWPHKGRGKRRIS